MSVSEGEEDELGNAALALDRKVCEGKKTTSGQKKHLESVLKTSAPTPFWSAWSRNAEYASQRLPAKRSGIEKTAAQERKERAKKASEKIGAKAVDAKSALKVDAKGVPKPTEARNVPKPVELRQQLLSAHFPRPIANINKLRQRVCSINIGNKRVAKKYGLAHASILSDASRRKALEIISCKTASKSAGEPCVSKSPGVQPLQHALSKKCMKKPAAKNVEESDRLSVEQTLQARKICMKKPAARTIANTCMKKPAARTVEDSCPSQARTHQQRKPPATNLCMKAKKKIAGKTNSKHQASKGHRAQSSQRPLPRQISEKVQHHNAAPACVPRVLKRKRKRIDASKLPVDSPVSAPPSKRKQKVKKKSGRIAKKVKASKAKAKKAVAKKAVAKKALAKRVVTKKAVARKGAAEIAVASATGTAGKSTAKTLALSASGKKKARDMAKAEIRKALSAQKRIVALASVGKKEAMRRVCMARKKLKQIK